LPNLQLDPFILGWLISDLDSYNWMSPPLPPHQHTTR